MYPAENTLTTTTEQEYKRKETHNDLNNKSKDE